MCAKQKNTSTRYKLWQGGLFARSQADSVECLREGVVANLLQLDGIWYEVFFVCALLDLQAFPF